MNQYSITSVNRRCAECSQELQPGQSIYSVLQVNDGKLVRVDYHSACWIGPPPEGIGYWKSKVPLSERKRTMVVDDETLFALFTRLEGASDSDQLNLRYVIALLLMRRKRLKFDSVEQVDSVNYLVLNDAQSKQHFRVVDPHLDDESITAVQQEIMRLLH
jgi:hypothetical protein